MGLIDSFFEAIEKDPQPRAVAKIVAPTETTNLAQRCRHDAIAFYQFLTEIPIDGVCTQYGQRDKLPSMFLHRSV